MRKVLLLAAALGVAVCAMAAEEPFHRTLTVTGTAEVKVAPDICYMSFIVSTRSRSAAQAYKDNNELMVKVNAAVKEVGIEARDLQTKDFSLKPEYHYDKGTSHRVFDGYLVNNSLSVTVRNLSKVPAVLDAALAAGAIEVGGVTFTVENPKKYTADARIEALRAAKAKAEVIAAETGVKLKRPVAISESEPNSYGWMYSQTSVAPTPVADREAESPPLEPGEIKITHTVYITYEIE
jgi:uncharacterized protein YggE